MKTKFYLSSIIEDLLIYNKVKRLINNTDGDKPLGAMTKAGITKDTASEYLTSAS